jgi:hypothetical protein
MPVAGPKPKNDRSQIVHRNTPTHEWTEVENVPFEGAPELRKRQTGGVSVMAVGAANSEDYPEATRGWWRAVSRMPHAKLWTDADWTLAMDGAEIHARTMEAWRGYTGGQLLAIAKQIGMTADYRRDLRIRYVEPKTPDASTLPENVKRLDDFRDL